MRLLTSKNDLSSVFFGAPAVGIAGVTDITSARSEIKESELDKHIEQIQRGKFFQQSKIKYLS